MSAVTNHVNYSINVSEHGGHCCGRYHIAELGYFGPRVEAVERIERLMGSAHTWNVLTGRFCVEITLTEEQAKQKPVGAKVGYPIQTFPVLEGDPYKGRTWHDVLTKTLAFKRVGKFLNPNSGNIVFVYLYFPE